MRRAIFAGVFLGSLSWGAISVYAQPYLSVGECVESRTQEIARKMSQTRSRCNEELRYINNCIANPANARTARDQSRRRGDWLQLKKQVEDRCQKELAELNRQRAEVWQFCNETVVRKEGRNLLGAVWEVTETGVTGTWRRRGQTTIFDGKWDDGAVGELTITLKGNEVRIVRKDESGPKVGDVIDYEGTISEDGKTVTGTMKSTAGQAPWSGVIKQGRR